MFDQLQQPHPTPEDGQRCAALRFGCARVQALLCALLAFRLLPRGFDNRQLRTQIGAGPQDADRGSALAAGEVHRDAAALEADAGECGDRLLGHAFRHLDECPRRLAMV